MCYCVIPGRPLLIFSCMGMTLSHLMLSLYFYVGVDHQATDTMGSGSGPFDQEGGSRYSLIPIIALALYLCFFSCGVGPVLLARQPSNATATTLRRNLIPFMHTCFCLL